MQALVWVAALTAVTLFIMGHNFAVGNHAIYLLWIERLRDPAFLLNDWYLTTPVMHPNIVGPLRRLGEWAGDSNAFLIALAVSRLLLVGGMWKLVRCIGGSRMAAGIGALLAVMSPRVSLGGHYISGAYFEASHLGMALATVSLAFLIQRRYVWAGLWLGATIHIHLFVGFHVALIEALALAWSLPDERKAATLLKRLMLVALPAALLGSWTIGSSLIEWLRAPEAAISGRDVVEILAFRHPHHHSPLMWRPQRVILFCVYVMLGLLLARRQQRWRQPVFRALFAYTAVGMVVGTVFVEWIPLELAALFQFFRVTVLLMAWTSAEVGIWLGGYLAGSWARMRPDWRAVLAVGAIAGFRVPVVFLPLAAILLVLEKLCPPLQAEIAISARRQAQGLGLGVAGLAAGIVLTLAGAQGHLNPLFERLGRPEHFRAQVESPEKSIREVSRWLRENTPEGSTVLMPPGMEGLPLFASRPVVVTFKQVTFTPPTLKEWIDRVIEVTLIGRMDPDLPRQSWGDPQQVLPRLHKIRRQSPESQETMDEGYRLLEPQEVKALAAKYNVNYFVTNSETKYPLPAVADVEGYVIYRMQ